LKRKIRKLVKESLQKRRHANQKIPLPRVRFDCRLYRVAPQAFLVWTDRSCYVEQYYFSLSREAQSAVPVVRFQTLDIETTHDTPFAWNNRTNMHSEMKDHFNWIWKKASISVDEWVDGGVMGYDMGLCQAGTVDVFMDQKQSAKRIISLLE